MPIAIAGLGYDGGAMGTEAVRFLVVWMAGWVNSRQLEVIDFLREVVRQAYGAWMAQVARNLTDGVDTWMGF